MTFVSLNRNIEVHHYWMAQALEQAKIAKQLGEIPVGAVLVDRDLGQLIAAAHNRPISNADPTAHAEIEVLRLAARLRDNYRLPGTILYVTIEPCTMCIGALIHARVDAVVFGAREPRAGAIVSQQRLADAPFFNHRMEYIEGILVEECSLVMQDFFKFKRNQNA